MNFKQTFAILLLFVGITVITRYQKQQDHRSEVQKNHMTVFLESARTFATQTLQEEERKLWALLKQANINQSTLTEYKNNNPYDDAECIIAYGDGLLEGPTKERVNAICTDFGFNNIPIYHYKGNVPAASTDSVLFVNETVFNNLKPEIKRFIIGHELQHVQNHDYHTRTVLKKIIQDRSIDQDKAEQLTNSYKRFMELRADLLTAIKDFDYALAYISYSQNLIAHQGNHGGITHPTHVQRLKLATNIIDRMFNQKAQA